jgi:lysophospholipase L1-like esterase
MRRSKSFFLQLCLALLLVQCLNAQSSAPFDSSYTNTYYSQKVSHFKLLSIDSESIVFLGDSITDSGEWAELLPTYSVVNRGISSDITFGLLARLSEIISAKPKKLFILIGINDIARGIPVTVILRNYQRIIDRIKEGSPETQIYVQSILPTNPAFPQFKGHQNKADIILTANIGLKHVAAQNGLIYVDLFTAFTNEDGFLKTEYTHDGLHLSGEGYLNWVSVLKQNNYLD